MTFTITITRDEDGMYIAVCPAIPGCVSQGKTEEEAQLNIQDAIKGSEFVLDVQTVIEAIGQKPNPIIQATTPGLKTGKRGTVEVDEKQATSRTGIFAGGDLSRGGATVILAMRDGKEAASAIHQYLVQKKETIEDKVPAGC